MTPEILFLGGKCCFLNEMYCDEDSFLCPRSPESQFVLPCLGEDVRRQEVDRPECPGVADRVRVYGQGELEGNIYNK